MPQARIQAFTLPTEALAFAQENQVDVAFLDQEMPGMDGMALGKKLTELYPNINLIYTTAYRQYGVEAFSLHASGYLLKPIQQADIRREMESLRYPLKQDDCSLRAVTFGSL